MKNASEILSHLFHPSMQSTIERHRCYRRFLASLPPKWQAAIAFLFVREATLYVALRHPGYKMELHYNRDLMKTLLTEFNRHNPHCRLGEIKRVAVFNSKFHTHKPSQTHSQTVPYYTEASTGEFLIQARDEEIVRRFDAIKEKIRCLKR